MHLQQQIAASLIAGAVSVSAQGYSYAGLTHPFEKDEPQVAANFPDVDYELLGPAFTLPDTVPEAFRNGTSGPTPQFVLGERSQRWFDIQLT